MDAHRFFLPSWGGEYWTDLSYEQIGYFLVENVITGASFYSRKPYYGQLAPQSFAVRRPWSRLKKANFSPSVRGMFGARNGQMIVSLRVSPHPFWLGIFAFLVFYGILYWLAALPEIWQTRDVSLLWRGLFPLAGIYGIGWSIFRAQCATDLRFWEQALRLRKIPA